MRPPKEMQNFLVRNIVQRPKNKRGKKVKLICANASGKQALTLRGLLNPGVLRLGEKNDECASHSRTSPKEKKKLKLNCNDTRSTPPLAGKDGGS